MLAGDERRPVRNAGDAKTGIGMTATTVIDAMSAYHEVADEPHPRKRHAAPRIPAPEQSSVKQFRRNIIFVVGTL